MNRFPTIFDVPEGLQSFASQRRATDLLDLSLGMTSVVVLRCPHCGDGWGLHWKNAVDSFRAHLQGDTCPGRSSSFTPATPKTSGGLRRLSGK